MNSLFHIRSAILIGICGAIFTLAASCSDSQTGSAPESPTSSDYSVQTENVMGGIHLSIKIWHSDKELREKAAKAAIEMVKSVETRFSTYRNDSEISLLNQRAHEKPFQCSDEMWTLLMASKDAYTYTNGAFDVTAGPLIKLWHIGRYSPREKHELPARKAIDKAKALTGFDKLILDENARTVQFSVQGMSLDFGGIAKGYAVDQAIRQLKDMKINCGLVDLGGNLRCLDQPPPKQVNYRVGIRHPRGGALSKIDSVMISRAIATSGDYQRYAMIDGKRYTHIMDIRTGQPVRGKLASVSVITDSAMTSDVLSTAIFIDQLNRIETYRKKFRDLRVLLMHQQSDGQFTQAWH